MFARIIITLALLSVGLNASAQIAPPEKVVTQVEPVTAIATKTEANADSEIAGRIQSIFSEIAPLKDVRVRVSAGVVTLMGVVPGAGDILRAEAIAGRVSGVVTVQNDLTRDLKVNTNLTPAIGQFGNDLRGLVQALPLLGVALAIAITIGLIGHLLASIDRLWRWITPNTFLAELVATFVRFAFIIFGLIAALEVLGATALLGGVLGGAGVIGVALGFAVRDTVDNYVSSLMLSLRQPFRANDHVVIDGNEGRVVRLTSRATVLMTLDGNHLRIPNAIVFKSVILNYTRNSERRFAFDLGVDADDNPVDGMAVGLAAINALKFVLDTPKASAIIQDVGDSNIVLRFFGWLDQNETDFFKGRSLAIYAAAQALIGAGFALPEPIYRLRFDEGASIPLTSMNDADGVPAKPRLRAKAPPPPPSDADTRPDDHIEQLVNEERAEGGPRDLLDSARPIE